jgi:hypothetical protein
MFKFLRAPGIVCPYGICRIAEFLAALFFCRSDRHEITDIEALYR